MKNVKDETVKTAVSYNTNSSFGTSNNNNNFNDGKHGYDYKDAHVIPGLLHDRLSEEVIKMYDEHLLENVNKLYDDRCNEYNK